MKETLTGSYDCSSDTAAAIFDVLLRNKPAFYEKPVVAACPYCGSEMLTAYQDAYGAVSGVQNKLGGCALYHSVCRNCGSIVRSYVKDPEKLLKKKDRKQ